MSFREGQAAADADNDNETPDGVAFVGEQLGAGDIAWQAAAYKGGMATRLGLAVQLKDNAGYVVQIAMHPNRRRNSFSEAIVHELLHVHMFKDGIPECDHHPKGSKKKQKEKRKKFRDTVNTANAYLRKRSSKLRLFEAWIDHLGGVKTYDNVQKAAKNALAGTAVPRKRE